MILQVSNGTYLRQFGNKLFVPAQSGCKRITENKLDQQDKRDRWQSNRYRYRHVSNKHAIRRRGMKRGQSERTSFSRGRDYVYPVYVTREPDMSIRSPRRSRKRTKERPRSGFEN